jgi:hypothetical protein
VGVCVCACVGVQISAPSNDAKLTSSDVCQTIEKQTVDRMKRRHKNIHNEILMEKRVSACSYSYSYSYSYNSRSLTLWQCR